MSALAKIQMLMLNLKERLQKRLPAGYVFQESADDKGLRLLISQDATPAAGEQVIAIRILAVASAHKDIVGQEKVFGPLKAQVIEEASTVSGVSLITLANRAHVDMELARLGIIQERYLNANGTVPAVSQFANDGTVSTSSLAAVIVPDLYYPLSGQ